MAEFSLTPRVAKIGDTISYQVNGLKTGYGYYIILIKNYNQSMNEYTLYQQQNVLAKATYRNPGTASYSGQYTLDSSDIETITVFYFGNYDYTGPSLNEYEQSTLLGDYTAKETFSVTVHNGKQISGIVSWLRSWFYTKEEMDTGWQPFPYKYQNRIATYCDENGNIRTVTFGKSNNNDSDTLLFDYPNQPLRIRRIGNIVHIEGATSSDLSFRDVGNQSAGFPLMGLCCGEHNATTFNGDYLFTIGTLSEEFRPSKSIITIQQGSGQNKYLVRIDPSGTVRIGRYGTTSYTNPAKNCWLNINVSYTVGD